MNRGGLLLAALLVAAAPLSDANARPADPIKMTASGGTQDGALQSATETKKSKKACSVLMVTPNTPEPAAVQHNGMPLVWRINDVRKPTKVTAVQFRYVPTVTFSINNSPLQLSLREVKQGAKVVAWELISPRFTIPGDYGITLTVEWKGACGTDAASRRYRVLTLAAVGGGGG